MSKVDLNSTFLGFHLHCSREMIVRLPRLCPGLWPAQDSRFGLSLQLLATANAENHLQHVRSRVFERSGAEYLILECGRNTKLMICG